MTIREQIKQTRRRNSLLCIAGLVMWAPPGLAAVIIKQDGAQPPEYWPLLVLLVLVGTVLLMIGVIGQWTLRCPKCRAVLGLVDPSKDKCCRRCGTDFDDGV